MSRASSKENLYLYDGWQNLSAGMDSSKTPDIISDGYAAILVNVTVRGGKPTNRPGFERIEFSSVDGSHTLLEYETFLGGYSISDPVLSKTYLVGNYGGHIILFDILQRTTRLLNSELDLFSPRQRTYFCQVEEYLVIQNGVDIPFIYNIQQGAIRRSKTGTNNPKLEIASITRTNTIATLTTSSPHGFSNGDYIEIQGTSPESYEGNFYISNVTPNTFDYDIGISSPSTPAVLEGGVSFTRYVPEVPTGTFMAYGQGRLFVASPNSTEFLAGDIITGDVKGTNENAMRFSETQYLAEGGSFNLPATMGEITGMVIIPFQDTSTGQGELFVFGEYGVASFNVSVPRSAVVDPQTLNIVVPGWKDTGIQKVVLTKVGCSSPTSITSYNGDIMWRSQIGIRTYRNARAEHNNYGVTPMSAEVNRILNRDNKNRLYYVSSESFNNRVFTTCTPVFAQRKLKIKSINNNKIVLFQKHGLPSGTLNLTIQSQENNADIVATVNTDGDLIVGTPSLVNQGANGFISGSQAGTEIYHRGVVVLDFTSVSGVGGKSTPAWDGVWTGLNFQHITSGIFKGEEKGFIFSYDEEKGNGIWEVVEDMPYDFDGEHIAPIQSVIETKAFRFGSEFGLKQLQTMSVWLSNISGAIEFDVKYRPDNFPCWVDWGSFARCADVQTSIPNEIDPFLTSTTQSLPQSRSRVDLPTPSDDVDPTSSALLRNFYNMQLRLQWSGKTSIDKVLLFAIDKPERINSFV